MSRDARFWRNVTIIAVVHLALLVALIRWSRAPQKSIAHDITWMNAGAGDEGATITTPATPSAAATEPTPEEESAKPTPEPSKEETVDEEKPILTSVPSDIRLPTSTPKPTPTATATPTGTSTPTPSATPNPTPKPTPKATPSPTPKKKKIIAKATPKPSVTPKKKAKDEDETAEVKKKKTIAKAALAKNESDAKEDESGDSSDKPVKKATAAHGGKKGGSGENRGEGSGSGGASEFGWYGNMLHDRFYSEWIQPTTVVASGAKISALVRIRIEKDGTISDFKITRPSGNVVFDESIEVVAKRVTQVDSLPTGLGDGDHYDVNINFEVNPSE
jgi:TonB family protein